MVNPERENPEITCVSKDITEGVKFKPTLIKEEPSPPHAIHCERCELSLQRKRVIWGEGNPQGPIFIILDNPGAREDKEGNSYICGTRETLQQGLTQVGIDLNCVYVTYLLKCRPIRAYNKPLAREACSIHLQLQLAEKKPQMLLGLGNTVAQSLLQDNEAEVIKLRGKWGLVGGIPIAFSYHPLAVRRRPNLFDSFIADLTLVYEELRKNNKSLFN